MSHPEAAPRGIGEALRQARIAQGLSLHSLAFDLNISVHLLEAVEAEAWDRLPPGRQRPYTRQVAERLGVDPEAFQEQWNLLPGAVDQEPPDPRRERQERLLMGVLTGGTLMLLLWLVVPVRSLRRARPETGIAAEPGAPARWIPTQPGGAFPVLGEVLPEAPVNDQGVLVSLRAMDACEVAIVRDQDPGNPQKHSLRISEPWQLRLKGPFSISLDNAGVATLDVAGRRIRHGTAVGQPWTGRFGENGEWIQPEAPVIKDVPTAPETDQEGE